MERDKKHSFEGKSLVVKWYADSDSDYEKGQDSVVDSEVDTDSAADVERPAPASDFVAATT
jgi:hypothetical protein